MKKLILCVLSLASLGVMAQSFTVADTLSAGDSQVYYTADSSALNLDGTTGTGVTWDYSGLTMYSGVSNIDTIKYATDSPNFGDFPNAEYHDDLSAGASVYFSNTPDSVLSYGFLLSVNGYSVKIMHSINEMKVVDLPMNLNNTFTDSTYGTVDVNGNIGTTAGDVVVIADGTGTLNLGASVFTNVIRIKTVETIETTVTIPFVGNVTGAVTRTAYNYYDFASQNQPVLIHGNISVASTAFNGGYTAVYSSVELPAINIGINKNTIEKVRVYPNPATNLVSIVSENANELVLMNALGQTITRIANPQATQQISLTNLETGVYFIQIKKGKGTKTRKLIVK